jgi:hypothetical protein
MSLDRLTPLVKQLDGTNVTCNCVCSGKIMSLDRLTPLVKQLDGTNVTCVINKDFTVLMVSSNF